MSKKPEYDKEDDSLDAALWRAERWAKGSTGGTRNVDWAGSGVSRATRDRHILTEEVRRLQAEAAEDARHW